MMMVNETKTCDSMKYEDVGERIVMLFGVNIAKKPTKFDDIKSIHADNKNEISIFDTGESSNHDKMKKELEQRSEKEKEIKENDNDNNNLPELVIGQAPNHERIRRVKSWTEMEHKAFLKGLKAVGKGRWKNISRNFVITKTPTQVASHAQKYFQRREPIVHKTKRQSIFDMKLLDDEYQNSKASAA